MTGVSAPAGFRGFPEAALPFYAGLEAENTKAHWTAERHVYDDEVVPAFAALSDAVEEEFGVFRLTRPYRDVRFSKDKSAYKTRAYGRAEGEGGASYYVQLSAEGLGAGAGYFHLAPDQLERYRAAIDDDRRGARLVEVVDELGGAEAVVSFDQLKTAPRGWSRDHPRIDLLRRKGLALYEDLGAGRWLHRPEALDRITALWRRADPLVQWLDTNVGPTEIPPDEMRRR
jgi:uncharacterized protein (TIGR02453 family)